MNILINCSTLAKGGGLQVAHSFLYEIKNNKEHKFLVVCSENLYNQIDRSLFKCNFKFYSYNIKIKISKIFYARDPFLDEIVKSENVNRVFTLFGPSYWKPKVRHICGYAKPQYIYKDSPFFKQLSNKELFYLKAKEFLQLYDFKRNNCEIITENKDVSDRLSLILNKPIHTVTNFYNQVFDKRPKNIFKELKKLNGIKLLTISANYPHKNLQIIPKVIDYLHKKYKNFKFYFILTIDESELILKHNQKKHVIFLGKIDVEDCPSLYSIADFMFLPTLLECFSASYPEAMKMETPILTSNLNFAKGICDDAAIYFDPYSSESIGDKIFDLSNNTKLQYKLKKLGVKQLKKFDTSKDRAKKYLQIIQK